MMTPENASTGQLQAIKQGCREMTLLRVGGFRPSGSIRRALSGL